jgi:rhomboid protease GluP
MAAFSLYFGFTSEGVGNAAHVGGLICGFLLAVLLYHPSQRAG